MEALLSRYRSLTVLLLVLFAELLLLAYQVKSQQDVRLIRVWAVTAITPLARVIETFRSNSVGLVRDYILLTDVKEENRKLKEELAQLKLETHHLRAELSTAERARALTAFQARTPSKTVAARVIGSGTGSNAKVVFVDRGSTEGVMRGMAVITPDGIVGKVQAAYPTASQVLLITDPVFAAGVISAKNRVHGTIKGQGYSSCIIDHVQNEEKVDIGEVFYTSGEDRVFPKGLPAGVVKAVRAGKPFKEIHVSPVGMQHGIEEVLIVLQSVHGELPGPEQMSAPGTYLAPPPPSQSTGAETTAVPSSINTPADRLLDKYRRIGEAQGHKFGHGLPGSRPPDFALNPDKVKPIPQPSKPEATKPAAAKPQAIKPQASTPPRAKPPAAKPQAPRPESSKPEAGSPKPPGRSGQPATAPRTAPIRTQESATPPPDTAPPPAPGRGGTP
jgi:rod shape-determining protein MreC